jgi:hypothetical protein
MKLFRIKTKEKVLPKLYESREAAAAAIEQIAETFFKLESEQDDFKFRFEIIEV